MKERLERISADISVEEINMYVTKINEVLKKENGSGYITYNIDEIKYSIPSFRGACGWAITGVGAYAGAVARFAGPPGWFAFGLGTAIGAMGNLCP